MATISEPQYIIPERYRKMENLHIIFWLAKDISWCLVWKPLGIAMIFPTLIISLVIAYRTRNLTAELAHNLAISFWIAANSLWMVSEFLNFDTTIIWPGFTGKHLALIPFGIGALLLIYYYAFQRPKENRATETVSQ